MKERILFLLIIGFIFLLSVKFGFSPSSTFLPLACQDSDGDCDVVRINESDGIYEMVDLLTYPFGWINVSLFTNSIPEENTIDSAYIHVLWFSDVGEGASNVNIDYWNGSYWVNCAGPFGENGTLSDTTCYISSFTKEQLNNIKVRFRGEDTDGFPNAFGYVDHIYMEVNHSSPPKWANQTTNDTDNFIFYKDAINLTAQGFDDVGLSYAWLSTNETGVWKNYTDGTYSSPMFLDNVVNEWRWSNFTWKNDSFLSGTVAWKIYYNDTTGKENSTNEEIFYVQFRRLPTDCQDSDGDCSVSNINATDDVFEFVDLLTSPFGWINASDWDVDVPTGNQIVSAKLYVLWKTDVGFGASNINIDYWDSSSWVNCAGPFGENGTVQTSICDVSSLNLNQFNSIKVRFRGEDEDWFPNAFAYVDDIYLLANFTPSENIYLEVQLVSPYPSMTTYVVQNQTFTVNATVICRGGNCGNVNATLRYNLTSAYPDTPVNTSEGEKPFYIQEPPYPSDSTKYCQNNPLTQDSFCNITWVVNATGDTDTTWKIGALFESSNANVQKNSTDNATLYVTACIEDIGLAWSSIDFGFLSPNTNYNPAPYNNQNFYNVTNKGTCTLTLWIKGTDLENSTLGTTITVGNISWSNTTNEPSSSFNMTYSYVLLNSSLAQNENLTTYYWLSVPPVYAGYYTGSVFVCGNYTSIC